MADFEVLWTEAAQLDLQRIVTFIAAENPARALAVSRAGVAAYWPSLSAEKDERVGGQEL